jgi:hypothetical protein
MKLKQKEANCDRKCLQEYNRTIDAFHNDKVTVDAKAKQIAKDNAVKVCPTAEKCFVK